MNPAKFQLGLPAVEFLGHRVCSQGTVPLPANVEAFSAFSHPSSVKTLQVFLGIMDFYDRFIPRANQYAPLVKST